jgi:hypothetical protein
MSNDGQLAIYLTAKPLIGRFAPGPLNLLLEGLPRETTETERTKEMSRMMRLRLNSFETQKT